jgi:hypothetical protein
MEPLPGTTKLDLWLEDFLKWKTLIMVKLFSHFVKITSLCIFIALATIYHYHKHQIDVQTTFLRGMKFLCNNHLGM